MSTTCGSMPHHSWICTTPGNGSWPSGRIIKPVTRLPLTWISIVSLCRTAMRQNLLLLMHGFEVLGRGPTQRAFGIPSADLPPGHAACRLRTALDLDPRSVRHGADDAPIQARRLAHAQPTTVESGHFRV